MFGSVHKKKIIQYWKKVGNAWLVKIFCYFIVLLFKPNNCSTWIFNVVYLQIILNWLIRVESFHFKTEKMLNQSYLLKCIELLPCELKYISICLN